MSITRFSGAGIAIPSGAGGRHFAAMLQIPRFAWDEADEKMSNQSSRDAWLLSIFLRSIIDAPLLMRLDSLR
jgi:hypothetical protein